MVAAAVIGAGVLTAGATAYSGSQASSATSSASNAAIAAQQQALQQQALLSKPYRDLGTNTIPTYQDLLTGGGKGAAGIQQTLESLPGYQFTRDQGIEAAKRASPNLSGNQVIAAETFGANLADTTYSQRLNELLQPIQLGQAAAAGQAANVGTSASNIGNIGINQGQTTAAIDANTIAGITKAGSNAFNQYLTYQTLQSLNNPASTPPITYGGGYQVPITPGVNAPPDTVIPT
jgi:hypothetical protein